MMRILLFYTDSMAIVSTYEHLEQTFIILE